MSDMILNQIFPTTILSVPNENDFFTEEERKKMVEWIDHLSTNPDVVYTNEYSPKIMSRSILFKAGTDPVFEKLKYSFSRACKEYLTAVKLSANQECVQFVTAEAWFLKSEEQHMNAKEHIVSAWHEHNPAYLSGVFYLSVPGDLEESGTEFHDPRMAPAVSKNNHVAVPAIDLGWNIYPGWLQHRPTRVVGNKPRYTIAADLFVVVDDFTTHMRANDKQANNPKELTPLPTNKPNDIRPGKNIFGKA